MCRIVPVMIGAMPLMQAVSGTNWVGSHRKLLRAVSARQYSGIWTIWPGAGMCRTAAINGNGWEQVHERYYSGRRLRHQVVSHYHGGLQAAPAYLRQANDLLPVVRADAGGYSRHPDYHHSGRSSRF